MKRTSSAPAKDELLTAPVDDSGGQRFAERRTAFLQAGRVRRTAVVTLRRRALASQSLRDVFDAALEAASSVLEWEFAKIGEYDATRDTLVIRAVRGWHHDMVGHRVECASTSCQSGYAIRMQRPLVIENLQLVPQMRDISFIRGRTLASGATVIVHGQHGEYGALTMHSTQNRMLTPDELDFLQAVADVIAAAVYRFDVSVPNHPRRLSRRASAGTTTPRHE